MNRTILLVLLAFSPTAATLLQPAPAAAQGLSHSRVSTCDECGRTHVSGEIRGRNYRPTACDCLEWERFVANGGNGCGSDVVLPAFRFLVPQGAFGASFGRACSRHDMCYVSRGVSRRGCDARFRRNLMCACERDSYFPGGCKVVASLMHLFTTTFGQRSFEQSQVQSRVCPHMLRQMRMRDGYAGAAH